MANSPAHRTNAPERRSSLAARQPKDDKRTAGRTTAAHTPAVIRAHGVDIDDVFDSYVRQRLGFKLGKFAVSITSVTVRFDNLSGPKGAARIQCLIAMQLPKVDPVTVTAEHPDMRAAFDRAIDTCERTLRRMLDRRRGQLRTRARRRA